MIPLLRIAPPTYRWQIRRRIVRWYRDLIALEENLATAARTDDRRDFEKSPNGGLNGFRTRSGR